MCFLTATTLSGAKLRHVGDHRSGAYCLAVANVEYLEEFRDEMVSVCAAALHTALSIKKRPLQSNQSL